MKRKKEKQEKQNNDDEEEKDVEGKEGEEDEKAAVSFLFLTSVVRICMIRIFAHN